MRHQLLYSDVAKGRALMLKLRLKLRLKLTKQNYIGIRHLLET